MKKTMTAVEKRNAELKAIAEFEKTKKITVLKSAEREKSASEILAELESEANEVKIDAKIEASIDAKIDAKIDANEAKIEAKRNAKHEAKIEAKTNEVNLAVSSATIEADYVVKNLTTYKENVMKDNKISNIEIMKTLISNKASEREIRDFFMTRYNYRYDADENTRYDNATDTRWVCKRIAIYKKIAMKELDL